MTAARIRKANGADLAAIHDVEVSAADAFVRFGRPLPDGSPPAPAAQWRAAMAADLAWVVEHGGEVVGFLAGRAAGEVLHIDEMDVRSDRQRRGLGRALLEAALKAAKGRGFASVTLTTYRDIPWNAPFYARAGFQELEEGNIDERLSDILADEARRGFRDRCAMRIAL